MGGNLVKCEAHIVLGLLSSKITTQLPVRLDRMPRTVSVGNPRSGCDVLALQATMSIPVLPPPPMDKSDAAHHSRRRTGRCPTRGDNAGAIFRSSQRPHAQPAQGEQFQAQYAWHLFSFPFLLPSNLTMHVFNRVPFMPGISSFFLSFCKRWTAQRV